MGNVAQSEDLRKSINRLKQGLLIDETRIVLAAHAKINAFGSLAVQPILDELDILDFNDIALPNVVNLVTGLAIVLHDLDEDKSKTYLDKALASECDPAIERVFSSLRQFSLSNYLLKDYGEILILENKSLGQNGKATELVQSWLTFLPKEDIAGISRLYIIDYDANFDFAGYHLGYLDVIVLVWKVPRFPLHPLRGLQKFFVNQTLYHEVGHHCLDHSEFGQDPKQEKEANEYAYKHLLLYYPKIRKFGLVLKWMIELVRK